MLRDLPVGAGSHPTKSHPLRTRCQHPRRPNACHALHRHPARSRVPHPPVGVTTAMKAAAHLLLGVVPPSSLSSPGAAMNEALIHLSATPNTDRVMCGIKKEDEAVPYVGLLFWQARGEIDRVLPRLREGGDVNVCVECQADGVLEACGNWYCIDHVEEGFIEVGRYLARLRGWPMSPTPRTNYGTGLANNRGDGIPTSGSSTSSSSSPPSPSSWRG